MIEKIENAIGWFLLRAIVAIAIGWLVVWGRDALIEELNK